MQELKSLFQESLTIDFITGIFSNPRIKDDIKKIKVRPLMKGEQLYFQFEQYTQTQVFHENLLPEEAIEKCVALMDDFRQLQMETKSMQHSVLVSKKGKATVKSKKQTNAAAPVDLSHNRKKQYILQEGVFVPFLKDLGVMTEDGKIVRDESRGGYGYEN